MKTKSNMRVRFALAVLLTLGAQATVTASTSYTFGASSNISLASETTPYTAGSWTEAVYPNIATTGQQIDCVAALATITDICGTPGPGNSVSISIPTAPGNTGILPGPPANYLMVDGDPHYGAPVWTKMTNLIVNENYVVSFYQASSEEDGSNQHYHDNWEVYVIPGASSGPYLCPQSNCAGVTTQTTDPVVPYQSPQMNNAGGVSTNWVKESFSFNATNTSEILEFVTNAVIVGAGTFVPPFLALADVTLDTPEPGTWALAALGVGLVFGAARRRSAGRG